MSKYRSVKISDVSVKVIDVVGEEIMPLLEGCGTRRGKGRVFDDLPGIDRCAGDGGVSPGSSKKGVGGGGRHGSGR